MAFSKANYILVGILVILIVLLFLSFQPPSSPNQKATITTQQSNSTGAKIGYNDTGPATNQSNETNVGYSPVPVGSLYCIGGASNYSEITNITNSTDVATLYNASVYDIYNIYGANYYNVSGVNFSWSPTVAYPLPISQASCVTNSKYVFCIGGQLPESNGTMINDTNRVYSAQLYKNGFSQWLQTSSYPQNEDGGSCVISGGYVYCIGGQINFNASSKSYYAAINGQQLGQWHPTTSYLQPIEHESCIAYNGYVYCIGGLIEIENNEFFENTFEDTNETYYAALTQSGIGTWNPTTSYPIGVSSARCVQSNGYIYCVGGDPIYGISNQTYYAQLTNLGIGSWKRSSNYPDLGATAGPSDCVANANVIYCIGAEDQIRNVFNASYFATSSQSGIGQWAPFSNYTRPIQGQSCIST
ncbi:MAG: hypothetical protein KGH67_01695 [Candidatus Micrarchaeota archaeon]|nr:hypothetical protein [Candidatus Micrarchaeota archaeon]MDE1859220.1 hypothetical protein [Candidatus Micrarchaeota archaeon]